jgi:hypothetical protein
MPIREKMPKETSGGQLLSPHVPSHAQTAAKVRGLSPTALGFTAETDSALEEAVTSELVSEMPISLVTGKNTGKSGIRAQMGPTKTTKTRLWRLQMPIA